MSDFFQKMKRYLDGEISYMDLYDLPPWKDEYEDTGMIVHPDPRTEALMRGTHVQIVRQDGRIKALETENARLKAQLDGLMAQITCKCGHTILDHDEGDCLEADDEGDNCPCDGFMPSDSPED